MEHCKSLRGTPRILSRDCVCVSTPLRRVSKPCMTNTQLTLVMLGSIMRRSFMFSMTSFGQLPGTTEFNCLMSKRFSGTREP